MIITSKSKTEQKYKAITEPKMEDLEWAVASRHKNQECALNLYRLLVKYEDKKGWNKDNSFVARSLVGIAFSLWRAAFLADKEDGTNEASRRKARTFLGTVIQENAIAFGQDRKNKEWSYDYYIENAFLRLRHLHNDHDWLMSTPPDWPYDKKRSRRSIEHWKEHWNTAHDFLAEAVKSFKSRLETKMPDQRAA